MSVRFEFDRDFAVAVTGGASGIGAAAATLFADSGASVYAIDADDEHVRALAAKRADGAITPLVADVSDEQSLEAAIHAIAENRSALSALVTSAGVAVHGSAGDLTTAEWERAMSVNLRGTWLSAKLALPLLRRSPTSAIVLLASVHAFRTIPSNAAYAASKAGIVALARSMAIDYAADGVRVNAVAPGGVDTPMTTAVLRAHGASDPSEFTARYPMRRFGTAEELANVIAWLAAPGCPFMTGVPVVVDGGLLARL